MGISLKGLYDYERLQKQNEHLAAELHNLQAQHESDRKDHEKSLDYWTGLLQSMKDDLAAMEKGNRLLRRENEKQQRKIKELESRERVRWYYHLGVAGTIGWVPSDAPLDAIAKKVPYPIRNYDDDGSIVIPKEADKHAN